MKNVNFIFRNKIYKLTVEQDKLFVYYGDGSKCMQTTLQEISKINTPFSRLVILICKSLIC